MNIPSFSVTYESTGKSKKSNELGMREMQERAYEKRGEQYLIIKSPPASGKSRALMFLALDKTTNQDIQQAIIIVPEKTIGKSFDNTKLRDYGFWADWEVKPKWILCNSPGEDGGKVKSVKAFLESEDKNLVCTHATFRFAVEKFGIDKVSKVVPGGKLRQDSVRMGLETLNGQHDLVLIHDGVRPMVEPDLVEAVIQTALKHRAAISALPAKETVKAVDNHRQVAATYDRTKVWMVQTPQAFHYKDILKAHREALKNGLTKATDDAFLVEKLGIPIRVVLGSERNIKVTTPHDLALAQFLLRLEHSS